MWETTSLNYILVVCEVCSEEKNVKKNNSGPVEWPIRGSSELQLVALENKTKQKGAQAGTAKAIDL